MIFVPGTSANPAKAAFPVSPDVAVKITISFFTRFQKPPVLQDILNVALPAQTKLDCVNAVTNYLSAA